MKITLAKFLYNAILNLLVCLALCLASAALTGFRSFEPVPFFLNLLLSYALAMLIGLLIPLMAIGKAFAGLFKVKNDTYTGHLAYRLLATFIIAMIFYLIISPSLALFNYFLYGYMDPLAAFLSFLRSMPFLFLVDFLSSLLFDIPAYRLAHRVDPAF
jgi:hypothetical protein